MVDRQQSQHPRWSSRYLIRCFFVLGQLFEAIGAFTFDSAWSIPKLTSVASSDSNIISRRQAFILLITNEIVTKAIVSNAWADDDDTTSNEATVAVTNSVDDIYVNRDRKGNQQAVIRDDYWYVTGKLPPRLLQSPLKGDDPQWNAFGSCTTSESTGTNSCTYVSLNQRRAAYTKYASSIAYGAKEYQKLGVLLRSIQKSGTSIESNIQLWHDAESLLQQVNLSPPPGAIDAELKMVLFATAMLTSPNFPGPSRELLVARFYSNEVRFAHREIYDAIQDRNMVRAMNGWEFGRDSWNSYFQSVARSVVPKVGDPFVAIA
jgi:hypothetical protein